MLQALITLPRINTRKLPHSFSFVDLILKGKHGNVTQSVTVNRFFPSLFSAITTRRMSCLSPVVTMLQAFHSTVESDKCFLAHLLCSYCRDERNLMQHYFVRQIIAVGLMLLGTNWSEGNILLG